MLFKVICRRCDASYEIDDCGTQTAPTHCAYCGGKQIELGDSENAPTLIDGYICAIEQYINSNLDEDVAEKISDDDIYQIADDMCSSDDLSNMVQEEIADRVNSLIKTIV